MPVAIIAIILEIAMYFHFVTGLEKHYQNVEAATTNVNTISGIHPTSTSGVVETSSYLHVSWQFYLIPNFHYIWNGQMSDRTL